jgi:hypothetical protein
VSVQDQFGTSTGLTLTHPNKLCAPTNKQNEDPGAQNDPQHLKAYQDKHNGPKVLNQTVVNQFGSVQLDVSRPNLLLVPTAKSTVSTPPALTPPVIDHFQCYKVKRSRGAPKFARVSGVTGQDQFGAYNVDLLKPRYLCAPASKNGEDPTAPLHPEHLLCYKTRNNTAFPERVVFTTDQFGAQSVRITRRIELCVPSLKNPQGTTTTSTSVQTTSSTSSTASTSSSTSTSTTFGSTTVTTSSTTSSSTSSSTSSTTLYGSPSRAFTERVRSLLD